MCVTYRKSHHQTLCGIQEIKTPTMPEVENM